MLKYKELDEHRKDIVKETRKVLNELFPNSLKRYLYFTKENDEYSPYLKISFKIETKDSELIKSYIPFGMGWSKSTTFNFLFGIHTIKEHVYEMLLDHEILSYHCKVEKL